MGGFNTRVLTAVTDRGPASSRIDNSVLTPPAHPPIVEKAYWVGSCNIPAILMKNFIHYLMYSFQESIS